MDGLRVNSGRRDFLRSGAAVTAGLAGVGAGYLAEPSFAEDPGMFVVGPRAGYSPQIGTLVSMMAVMRWQVLKAVNGLSMKDLDFLMDEKANRIGALLLHLAAVEKFFQLNTFQGIPADKMPEDWKAKWVPARYLGAPGRKEIQGQPLDYYLNIMGETREETLAEFRKRDDAWMMAVDKGWSWGPMNNYCKWFHVTEHESNHNGQIKLLKGRLPGAKAAGE